MYKLLEMELMPPQELIIESFGMSDYAREIEKMVNAKNEEVSYFESEMDPPVGICFYVSEGNLEEFELARKCLHQIILSDLKAKGPIIQIKTPI
jgi:hypothetical protein